MWNVEEWTYGGLRIFQGKRVHIWIDQNDQELHYSEGGSFLVGGIYAVETERTADVLRRRRPRFTGRQVPREQRQLFMASDKVTRTYLERLAMQQRMLQADAFEQAVKPLIRLSRQFKSQSERDALAAMVLQRIALPPEKRHAS